MQFGEDDLNSRQASLWLLVNGDATTIVMHFCGAVWVQGHLDLVAMTTERLIDGVVDDLPQTMHQTASVCGADIHPRALAHGFKAFQDQQMLRVVGVVDDPDLFMGRSELTDCELAPADAGSSARQLVVTKKYPVTLVG